MRRPIAIVLSMLLSLPMLLAQSKSSEEATTAMSDRAQADLRGPVRSSTEESTFQDASGQTSQLPFKHITVYDSEGHLLSTCNRNTDGSSWVTRNEYSNSGQLLKSVSGTEGQALTETTYSYDPQHRLQKITTDGSGTPILFRYDEQGRKTMIETSRASDYRPNVASGGSPFEAAGPPNLPGGGTATTIYDEHDWPVEVQVRDANGELVYRALRTYNAQGHLSDEKLVYENLIAMFPPDAHQKILDESGLSAEQLQQELHAQLTTLMNGREDSYSVTNRYDPAGRLIHTDRRIFNMDDDIDTTYNEHGNKESEITLSTRPGSENASPEGSRSYSETHYSYQYDEHSNWTEQTIEYRSSRDATFQPSAVIKRSLTYY